MSPINDKAVRRQIARVFKSYLSESPNASKNKFTLKDLDGIGKLLGEIRKAANSQVATHYKQELSISYLSILALTVTCLSMNQENSSKPPIPKEWLNSNGLPNPNFVIQNLLLQVTNYSLAVIRLVEDGLDNAARCVLRALIELSGQLLVLSSDRSLLATYVKETAPEAAKQVWYELFARKGRLSKKLAALEVSLGLPASFTSELRSYRKEMNSIHSEAVHHSFAATVVGAYAGDFKEEDYLHIALLGKASTASRLTLDTLNTTLLYTLLVFSHILSKVHGFRAQPEDKFWRDAFLLIECVRSVSLADDNN